MTKRSSDSFVQRDIGLRADFRGANYEPNTMVTTARLKQLEAQRAKARADFPTPRPRGIDHARIQSEADKLNERQIEHHKTRLMVADLGFKRDRLKAMNKGRAKASFSKATPSPVRKISRERAR